MGEYENWMKENCLETCGLCGGGTCEDKHTDCGTYKDYCRNAGIAWENWMKENCPKTCGCNGGATTTSPTTTIGMYNWLA